MDYKVVVVQTEGGCCCKQSGSLDDEIERACNRMAASGYVLVAAYPDTVSQIGSCQNQVRRVVFLIFASRP